MKSNPLSLRLSYNKYWLNQDSIRFKNISLYYSYNINLDRLISNLLLSQKLRKLGIIYSHTICKFNNISTYNVVKCVNKLIKLNIFLADIRLNDYIRNNRKRKKYKCIRKIFKVNKRNYWFRKQYSINCNKSVRIKQYNFMIRYMKEQYILTFIHFYMKLKSMKYFFKHLRSILFFISNLKQIKKRNKYLRIFKRIQYKVHYDIVSPKHQFKKINNFQRKQNRCATKLLCIGWRRIKPHYTILKKLYHLRKLWLLCQQKLIKKKCRLYKYSHSFIYKSRIKYLLHTNYNLYIILNKKRYLNKIQINVMKNLYRRINLNKFLFIMKNIKELNKLSNLYLYRNKRQIKLKKLNNINFRKLLIQRLLYYYLRRIKNNITTVFGM